MARGTDERLGLEMDALVALEVVVAGKGGFAVVAGVWTLPRVDPIVGAQIVEPVKDLVTPRPRAAVQMWRTDRVPAALLEAVDGIIADILLSRRILHHKLQGAVVALLH